jgi:hypothetical protein
MKANLLGKNLLPSKGHILHGRWVAHVINLIVQDGLAITCMAVDNIISERASNMLEAPHRGKRSSKT